MIEKENPPRIIFGLTPRATIINAVILLFIGQLIWSYAFVQQMPIGFDIKNPPQDFNLDINVPWYYDLPFTVLSIVMGLTWIQHVYKIENGDFSWRAIRYKYIYLLGSLFIASNIMKFILLTILL